MPIPQEIIDDVALTNVKVLAGRPASLVLAGAENLQAHQQRMLAIQADAQATSSAAAGMLQKRVAEVDQPEANALGSLTRATVPSEVIASSVAAAVAQVLSKMAGNTPPVTP
jgi:hypothetical protein